jgi:hypothetical protein
LNIRARLVLIPTVFNIPKKNKNLWNVESYSPQRIFGLFCSWDLYKSPDMSKYND